MGAGVVRDSGQKTMWEEDIWDELLAHIDDHRVIPIIGPELLEVEAGGRTVRLDRYVAVLLAARLGLPPGPDGESLNEVVCRYREAPNYRRNKIYTSVHAILKSAALTPPRALTQLAEIEPFQLFVTTMFDSLLEDAINAVRFGGQPGCQSIAYASNDVRDLDRPKSQLAQPVVYHMLGRVSLEPSYVVSEEDLLEVVCALQSKPLQPQRLLEELLTNHLLVLGDTLPDWLSRLFLRTIRTDGGRWRKLSDDHALMTVVAGATSPGDRNLVLFLRYFSSNTQVFEGGGAVEFVDQLWRRWRERHPVSPGAAARTPRLAPTREMPPMAAFISYSRRDLEAVQELKAGLDAAGIPAWFDMQQLESGDDYHLRIRENVRNCGYFIPVISAHTEAETESFFRREWRLAADRATGMDERRAFILPVVVDDTTAPISVPDVFLAKQISWLPGGRLTNEFRHTLSRLFGVADESKP